MNIGFTKFLCAIVAVCNTLASVAAEEKISSASERIISSEKLDDAIVRAGAMALMNLSPALLEISPGGEDGAVLTLRFSNRSGGINSEVFPYRFINVPERSTAVVKLDEIIAPGKFRKYNRLSCLVYPEAPDKNALWFGLGGGSWTQAICPLRAREWNRIAITWDTRSAEDVEKFVNFHFSRNNHGKLPGDPDYSVFRFKDFQLEKYVPVTETGWNASPEKVILPQSGFSPAAPKLALLAPEHAGGKFALIADEGSEVFSGTLEERVFPTGTFAIADFSRFSVPGVYTLETSQLVSVPFAIEHGHFAATANKSCHFLRCMRSGTTTPAHGECFLDDCVRADNGEPVNMVGGWFDASDMRQYPAMAVATIMRPLAIAAAMKNGGADVLYDEARWGALYLDRLFDEKTGEPYTTLAYYATNDSDKRLSAAYKSQRAHWYQINNYWTDNLPGTGDERAVHCSRLFLCHPDRLETHLGLTAAGLLFRQAAHPADRELAERVARKCGKHFDRLITAGTAGLSKMNVGFAPDEDTLLLKLENAVALAELTGEKKHRELARELTELLLKRQERRFFRRTNGRPVTGFFWSNDTHNTVLVSPFRSGSPAGVLMRSGKLFADDPLGLKIHTALRLYSDWFYTNPALRAEPYSIAYEKLTLVEPPKGYNVQLGSDATGRVLYGAFTWWFLSGDAGALALDGPALAAALDDVRPVYAAESMLDYFTGMNQAGISLIAECGTNFKRNIMSTVLGWIPGMIGNPEMKDMIPSVSYTLHHQTNEIYTQTQGSFTAATTLLASPCDFMISTRDLPSGTTVEILDADSGKAVDVATPEPLSEFKLSLPAPGRFRLRFGNEFETEVTAMSGVARKLRVDPRDGVTVTAVVVPEQVVPNAACTVEIRLVNRSQKLPARFVLELYADNLVPARNSIKLELPPGGTLTRREMFRAGAAGIPFVLTAFVSGHQEEACSASGAVTAAADIGAATGDAK